MWVGWTFFTPSSLAFLVGSVLGTVPTIWSSGMLVDTSWVVSVASTLTMSSSLPSLTSLLPPSQANMWSQSDGVTVTLSPDPMLEGIPGVGKGTGLERMKCWELGD